MGRAMARICLLDTVTCREGVDIKDGKTTILLIISRKGLLDFFLINIAVLFSLYGS
jgi:hypothetical protein